MIVNIRLSHSYSAIFKSLCISALSLLCSILITSCAAGGGTDGSGLGKIYGQATEKNTGAPVPGLSVTILETGDGTVTDGAGQFSIETQIDGTPLTLLFEKGPDFSVPVKLTPDLVPDVKVQEINVDVVVDEPKKQVTVQQKQPAPTPTAAATPTERSTFPAATPTPEASRPTPPSSQETPTPPAHQPAPSTPGVAPTATAVATPTPLPTDTPPPNSSRPTPSPTASPLATKTPTAQPFSPGPCDCDLVPDGMLNVNDFAYATNQYAAGNFDFNRDGRTDRADLELFQTSTQNYIDAGVGCPQHGPTPTSTAIQGSR